MFEWEGGTGCFEMEQVGRLAQVLVQNAVGGQYDSFVVVELETGDHIGCCAESLYHDGRQIRGRKGPVGRDGGDIEHCTLLGRGIGGAGEGVVKRTEREVEGSETGT